MASVLGALRVPKVLGDLQGPAPQPSSSAETQLACSRRADWSRELSLGGGGADTPAEVLVTDDRSSQQGEWGLPEPYPPISETVLTHFSDDGNFPCWCDGTSCTSIRGFRSCVSSDCEENSLGRDPVPWLSANINQDC